VINDGPDCTTAYGHVCARRTYFAKHGHAVLAELSRSYDLLHPMLGEVRREGALIDLRPLLPPEALALIEADALGQLPGELLV
jgi:hypothetical protein